MSRPALKVSALKTEEKHDFLESNELLDVVKLQPFRVVTSKRLGSENNNLVCVSRPKGN